MEHMNPHHLSRRGKRVEHVSRPTHSEYPYSAPRADTRVFSIQGNHERPAPPSSTRAFWSDHVHKDERFVPYQSQYQPVRPASIVPSSVTVGRSQSPHGWEMSMVDETPAIPASAHSHFAYENRNMQRLPESNDSLKPKFKTRFPRIDAEMPTAPRLYAAMARKSRTPMTKAGAEITELGTRISAIEDRVREAQTTGVEHGMLAAIRETKTTLNTYYNTPGFLNGNMRARMDSLEGWIERVEREAREVSEKARKAKQEKGTLNRVETLQASMDRTQEKKILDRIGALQASIDRTQEMVGISYQDQNRLLRASQTMQEMAGISYQGQNQLLRASQTMQEMAGIKAVGDERRQLDELWKTTNGFRPDQRAVAEALCSMVEQHEQRKVWLDDVGHVQQRLTAGDMRVTQLVRQVQAAQGHGNGIGNVVTTAVDLARQLEGVQSHLGQAIGTCVIEIMDLIKALAVLVTVPAGKFSAEAVQQASAQAYGHQKAKLEQATAAATARCHELESAAPPLGLELQRAYDEACRLAGEQQRLEATAMEHSKRCTRLVQLEADMRSAMAHMDVLRASVEAVNQTGRR